MVSFEIIEKFCYLGDTKGTGAFDSVMTRIRSKWCEFRDLVALLAIRSKTKSYSVCVSRIMLYGSGTWPVK